MHTPLYPARLLLLLLLLPLPFSLSQSPISQPLRITEAPISVRLTIPPSKNGFQRIRYRLLLTPPTNLLAELHIPSAPPHSGSHAPLLSVSTGAPPKDPDTDSCPQAQPCPSGPFDAEAFYTRADTAIVALPVDEPTAYVAVYNWRLPDVPGSELKAVLHLRAVEELPALCPGVVRGTPCRGRGSCSSSGECRCERGWGGRSCGTRLSEAPATTDRPEWSGRVAPMRGSAVVTVPAEGVTYVWRVSRGGRVEFRARLLRGSYMDGGRQEVDGGGGVFEMVVKRPSENLGEGLEEGTRLPTAYDAGGVGRVVASSGDVYEVVTVGDGEGDWLMGLMVRGGTAVVSVSSRPCGGDGELDCAFGDGGSSFPVGVVVGVCVSGVVLLAVVVVLCLCWAKRRGRKERLSTSGAWTDVDVSRIEAMHEVRDDSVR